MLRSNVFDATEARENSAFVAFDGFLNSGFLWMD